MPQSALGKGGPNSFSQGSFVVHGPGRSTWQVTVNNGQERAAGLFLARLANTPEADALIASSLKQRRVFGKIGLLFCSGVTPMLLWRRFRPFTSLVYCWAAIGVAFLVLVNIAAASEEDEKLAQAAKDFIAGNGVRNAYVRGARDGCVNRNQLNKPAGMSTQQQIAAYCDCYANTLVKLITVEDYIYWAKNKRWPADFQEKNAQARAACWAAVNDTNKT